MRAVLRALRPGASAAATQVSSGYEIIAPADLVRLGGALETAWQDDLIPAAQHELVQAQLEAFWQGKTVPVFDVFVRLLQRIPDVSRKSLLEVGCSSGYYADVLRARGLLTRYAGCDYSASFVELARTRLPDLEFQVHEATRLGYPDASYDIVVSGCCILHIANYPAAIREAARVAREHVMFHRTPILHTTPTTHYRKLAYGVPCLEIHFNESDLLRHFASAGLRVIDVDTVTVDTEARSGDVRVMKSYLCEKV